MKLDLIKMSDLNKYLTIIKDLQKKRDTVIRQYYSMQDQLILLDLIIKEVENLPADYKLTENLYLALANIEKFRTTDIKAMCELFKKVIRFGNDYN